MTSPLTSVTVVCRSQPQAADISGVVWLIDAFLDVTRQWTIPSASGKCVPVRLLRRIAANEDQIVDREVMFKVGLGNAISSNSLETVKWLTKEYFPIGSLGPHVGVAVLYNRLEILRWFRAQNRVSEFWWKQAFWSASSLQTLRWLHNEALAMDFSVCTVVLKCAMKRGDLETIEWMLSADLPVDDLDVHDGVMQAVRLGYTHIVKWAGAQKEAVLDQSHMDEAVIHDQIEVAQWLFEAGVSNSIEASTIVKAATLLRFQSVEWALRTLHVLNTDQLHRAIHLAAKFSSVNVLDALSAAYTSICSTKTMDIAAGYGRLDAVKWLHSHRSEGCTTAAMDGAAKRNHLDVVQWLHSHRSEGCTTAAMDNAAAFGHLEMLKWLHSNRTEGCTTQAMTRAAANGHLDVVEWLFANRRESCSAYAELTASLHGHDHIVEWLRAHVVED